MPKVFCSYTATSSFQYAFSWWIQFDCQPTRNNSGPIQFSANKGGVGRGFQSPWPHKSTKDLASLVMHLSIVRRVLQLAPHNAWHHETLKEFYAIGEMTPDNGPQFTTVDGILYMKNLLHGPKDESKRDATKYISIW